MARRKVLHEVRQMDNMLENKRQEGMEKMRFYLTSNSQPPPLPRRPSVHQHTQPRRKVYVHIRTCIHSFEITAKQMMSLPQFCTVDGQDLVDLCPGCCCKHDFLLLPVRISVRTPVLPVQLIRSHIREFVTDVNHIGGDTQKKQTAKDDFLQIEGLFV